MHLRLSEVSPSHEKCFGFTSKYDQIIGTSNIADVELGGNGDEIPFIESYDWRNLAAMFGRDVRILLPKILKKSVTRDRELHSHYGLPAVNPVYFETSNGFNQDIKRVLESGCLNLTNAYMMTFEDNHEFIRLAQTNNLATSNESASIVRKLNDKVEMLTGDELFEVSGVSIPYGFEVNNVDNIESFKNALIELSRNLRFRDSLLSIKVAFGASGQGIIKGTLNNLITDLDDSNSKLSKWIRNNKKKPGQRFMVQEYYSPARTLKSPAFQFAVDNNGYNLLGISTQILVDDVHAGNVFYEEIFDELPGLDYGAEQIMNYVYESGFRGVIGADMLEFQNEQGESEYAFMEFNARWTGAVTPILFASAIKNEPATKLFFSSDNTFQTGNVSFEDLTEILSTSEFDPMYDGRGVALVSSAPMENEEKPKAQLLFLGHDPQDVVNVTNSFTVAMRGA